MKRGWVVPMALAALALALLPGRAQADLVMFVGYADGLRSNPFFPSPFLGDANVLDVGHALGQSLDAGAIRIDNTGGSPVLVDSVGVELHGPGSCIPFGNPCGRLNLWGSFTIPAGKTAVLTQTASFNFDTSDDTPLVACCTGVPKGTTPFPEIFLTVGGKTTEFDDTAHVLDTGGFDSAAIGNESLQWRPLGTCGINCPGGVVPEPSALLLVGSGLVAWGGLAWRRRRL